MKTCNKHEDCIVVYTTQYCPVCKELTKRDEIEGVRNSEIDELRKGISYIVEKD